MPSIVLVEESKDIATAGLERARRGGTVLVEDDQHGYWQTKARDPKVRMAQRAVLNLDKDECSMQLPASEVPPAASTDTQLDYAFYSLRKGVQARITDPKLECVKTRVQGNQGNMEFSSKAQYLTWAGETMLYSLRHHQQEVQPTMRASRGCHCGGMEINHSKSSAS